MVAHAAALRVRDRLALAQNSMALAEVFNEWDVNGDGKITKREFRQGVGMMKLSVPLEEINRLFDMWDPQGNGFLTLSDLREKMASLSAPAASEKEAGAEPPAGGAALGDDEDDEDDEDQEAQAQDIDGPGDAAGSLSSPPGGDAAPTRPRAGGRNGRNGRNGALPAAPKREPRAADHQTAAPAYPASAPAAPPDWVWTDPAYDTSYALPHVAAPPPTVLSHRGARKPAGAAPVRLGGTKSHAPSAAPNGADITPLWPTPPPSPPPALAPSPSRLSVGAMGASAKGLPNSQATTFARHMKQVVKQSAKEDLDRGKVWYFKFHYLMPLLAHLRFLDHGSRVVFPLAYLIATLIFGAGVSFGTESPLHGELGSGKYPCFDKRLLFADGSTKMGFAGF